MTTVFRPAARVLLPLAIAGVAAGCTPSKTSQCNRLLETVNKIRPVAEQFQQEGKSFEAAAKVAGAKNDLKGFKTSAANSANAFSGLTGKMDGIIKEIQSVDLKDETLVQLKDRYVQNATAVNGLFKDTTTALTTISQIENSPTGLKQLDQADRSLTATAGKMNSLVQEENRLVSDFNNYCEVKK
ncbi:MAG: hypothetical protein IGS48_22665 [Oscillatoriales cyanobacterium C42_A2020_001]|nr:hypothetical protein [Leptolyngbyaceae cyanobacterium C42_A2020_001]